MDHHGTKKQLTFPRKKQWDPHELQDQKIIDRGNISSVSEAEEK